MGSKRPRAPDLTATPPPRLSAFLHEAIPPGRPEVELWSNSLPSVPEGEAIDYCSVGATSASGITPETQSEPVAKKRRIECTGCKKGPFGANKSLYRHQRTCKDYCAQSNTSPESHPCGECEEICSRLDILRRHVQSTHRGQPRRRPPGSGNAPQRISFDTAPEPQRSEPQPQVVITTTPGLWNDSPFVFAGQYPTEFHTGSWVPEKTVDLGGPRSTFLDTNDITAPTLATYEHHAQIYSQAFTTPAAVPDLQSSGYIAVSSEDDRTPDENSTSQEEPPISAPSNDLTPATPKSSPASSAHEVATEPDGDRDDDADLAALADRSLNFSDVPYASANPVSQGRNLRPNQIRFPTSCPLCGDELGNGPYDNGKVKLHLERHKSRMEAITYGTVKDYEAHCFVCQIDFLDIRDLRRHQESVRTGRGCGFEFDHYGTKCTGHHPQDFFGTYVNPDHLSFKEALRHWEGFQRRAFEEYFNAYMKGTAPTNARSHGEIPRRRAFAQNLEVYLKGRASTDAQHTSRRSTGSLYSMMSLMSRKSIRSNFTTPVRFRYGEVAKVNLSGAQESLAGFIRDLAEACEKAELDVVRSLFSNGPLTTLRNVSEDDLRVEMDFSWFYPKPKIERVRCLQFMVEQGLNPSRSSVHNLVMALKLAMTMESEWAAAMTLLFEKNAPLKVQSRLTQYVFLFAVSHGMAGLISKLLKHGILDDSASEMPDAGFIQGLQTSSPLLNRPPPNEPVAYMYTSMEPGPCALLLALDLCQYQAASLLLEHGVEPAWGIDHLALSKSAMQNLHAAVYFDSRRPITLPCEYLSLLERRLLAPALIMI
jgi:hypothetical protein